MKKITLLLAAFVLFTSCDGLFDFPDTSGLKVSNISDLTMETTLGCHVDRKWTYDGGGNLSNDDSKYYWATSWSDIHCSQNGNNMTITAKGGYEAAPNGDHLHDINYNVTIEIEGFAEPFDNCKVSQLMFTKKDIGTPISTTQFWQRQIGDLAFTFKNIPVSVKPYINGDSGKATISFACDSRNINVFAFSEKVENRTIDKDTDIFQVKYIGGSKDYVGMAFSFDYRK